MEDNIPFGYDDNGKPNIGKFSGSSLGFRNFQTAKENEAREQREKEAQFDGCPQTPEEANYWFIQQRKKFQEENKEALEKRLKEIQDSFNK